MKYGITDWQRDRTRLNHDSLRNGFLPQLLKYRKILFGKVKDDKFKETFVSLSTAEWAVLEKELLSLLQRVEDEISPRVIINSPDFALSGKPVGGWLCEVLHAAWKKKYDIDHIIEYAQKDISSISSLFNALDYDRENKDTISELYIHCWDLTEQLSKFPHRIEG